MKNKRIPLLTVILSVMYVCMFAQNPSNHIPGFYIEGLRGGEISKADFLKADSIKCTDKTVIIESFSISFQWGGGDILEIISHSAEITPVMKEAIQKPGYTGKVWVENIKATYSNGVALKPQAISFKVR